MFGKKKQPLIKSLIAQDTYIEGNLKFTDGLRIDGEIVGDISANEGSSSILVISESATVTGRIYVDHAIINGRVNGPVHASELLEVQPKAQIEGNVSYKALEWHEGAVIVGKLRPISQDAEENGMFDRKKSPLIKSLIAQGSCVEGNLKFTDGLRIDGEVIGDISANEGSSSILVISESATVTGSIFADHVIINGRVKGPVYAAELLELQPKAQIEGEVSYRALEWHEGAVIFGELRPISQKEEKSILKLTANNI